MVANPGYYTGHGKTPPTIPVPKVAPRGPLKLTGPFTVANGRTLYFTGAAIQQQGVGSLGDAGLIQVISSSGAIGIQDVTENPTVHNLLITPKGVLSVEATGGDAYGYNSGVNPVAITNEGVIQAVSLHGNAYGSWDYGGYYGPTFDNRSGGLVAVWAADYGYGLLYGQVGVAFTNAGRIEVTAAHAVGVDGPSAFTNTGAIIAIDYTGDGGSIGVLISSASLYHGRSVTCVNSGLIQGDRAFYNENDVGPFTQTIAIDNSGRIVGQINLSNNAGADTITNTGKIYGAIACSGSSNAVLSNAGTIILPGGTSALTTVDNSGVIEGKGLLGASGTGAAITIEVGGLVDATGALTLSTPNGGLVNNGVLRADGGTLSIQAAVTGSGAAEVSSGTLSFGSTFSQDVTFTGSSGELVLAQSQAYGGTMTGFSASGGTTLDLRDIGFVNVDEASFSGSATDGTLTVGDGVHTARIALFGAYLASSFVAQSDGHSGTLVSALPAASPPAATLARPTEG